MYKLDQPFCSVFGGVDAEFVVRDIAESQYGRCYQVDVAIRDITRPYHGREIQVLLFDGSDRPLERLNHAADWSVLPGFAYRGSVSAFQAVVFAHAPLAPGVLAVELAGERRVFEIDGSKEVRQADRGGRGGDDGRRRQDPDKKKEGPRCCPDTFVTPTGEQPVTIVHHPGGEGAAVGAKPWIINATFKNTPPPCSCVCCEYRQRFKGVMEIKRPADAAFINISPTTDFAPGAKPGDPPTPIKGLNATTFVEDGKGVRAEPGKPLNSGRRNDLGPRATSEWIPQDYPDQCSYWNLDLPGGIFAGAFVPYHTTINVDVEWEATIVDVCNGDIVKKGPNTWKWVYQKSIIKP